MAIVKINRLERRIQELTARLEGMSNRNMERNVNRNNETKI
jgi:hypothetical protein